MGDYPFLYFGHGTSRVSDDLPLWLVFKDAVSSKQRAWIAGSMPEELRQWVADQGEIAWNQQTLYVNSGFDLKYAVQQYDDDHLSWLDDKLAALGQDDIARIISEVFDDEGYGPRNPKASTWELFDADLDLWIASVHQKQTLVLVVKDVRITTKHDSAWHRWSVDNAVGSLPELIGWLRQIDPQSPCIELGMPLLRQLFRSIPPKKLTDEQRLLAIDLLALQGEQKADVLAQLVASLPAKQRAAAVAELLETHHPQVLSLFLEAKTHKLLLDDTLFQLARREAPQCVLSTGWWQQWVTERLKIKSTSCNANDSRPSIPEPSLQWARRVFMLADANAAFEREAAEQPDDAYAQRRLREWNDLRSWLSL